ncbi:hypothetical protein SKAU_G00050760 [Synaphobranchus kaupii]|uniref:Uncharacterized protein n=1 Tax=Synaphobranchus kaupii TaxID=118154 RepID=A0A9Q1G3V5_SYNKA|nr:hypothetical protein SKAU_G00050760 [Synaphobranchus kaupii]
MSPCSEPCSPPAPRPPPVPATQIISPSPRANLLVFNRFLGERTQSRAEYERPVPAVELSSVIFRHPVFRVCDLPNIFLPPFEKRLEPPPPVSRVQLAEVGKRSSPLPPPIPAHHSSQLRSGLSRRAQRSLTLMHGLGINRVFV